MIEDIPTAVLPDPLSPFSYQAGIDACRTALNARFPKALTGRESRMKSYTDDGPLAGVFIAQSIHCHCHAQAQKRNLPMLSIQRPE